MKKLFTICATLLGVLFAVCCTPPEKGTEQQPGNFTKPEITLQEEEVSANSFSFTVTTTIAGELGYDVVVEGGKTPTIDEILSRNTVEVKDSATITIDNLNDNTSYTLFAVLRGSNGGILSSPAKLSFTTPDDGVDSPITIKEIGYDNVNFTINLSGPILFQCIDKGSLAAFGQNIESYFSTEGIAIRSQGPLDVEWANGGRYGDYEMRMREDSEYYVIAAQSDGATPYPNIVGQIYYQEFKTLRKPVSNAGLKTDLSEITSTSVRIKTTPDSTVTEYYVWIRTVLEYDYYVSVGGEAIVCSMIQRGDSGSWHLTEKNDATWTGLTPDTNYYCVIFVKDNKGATALSTIPFTTPGKTLEAPEVTISITEPEKNAHNTLNLNIYSESAKSAKVVFRPTPEVMERRNEGYDDEYIASNMGTELSAEQVAAIASTGLTIVMENLWPEVEYTALVYIENMEQTATIKATTHYTTAQAPAPRVESNLFTSLLGEWRLTYDLVQENLVEARVSEIVTIAQGVDDKTNTDYRNQNRLVILGFPFEVTVQGDCEEIPVYLPADLLDARPKYYSYSPNLVYRDYGPKIFLEIGEGNTLSIPSSNTCPLFNWSDMGAYYFCGGDFDTRGAAPVTFPVTLSADGDTLIIGACHAGEEYFNGTYRPSVYLDNSATPRMEAWGVSDVILERVK